jgi:acetyl esterase/lipase
MQVPIHGARTLAAKLREQSRRPVVLVELAGGHHVFDLACSWRVSAVLRGIEVFLADPRVVVARAAASA